MRNAGRHAASVILASAMLAAAFLVSSCGTSGAGLDSGTGDTEERDPGPSGPGDEGVGGSDEITGDAPSSDLPPDDPSGEANSEDATPAEPSIVAIPTPVVMSGVACDVATQRTLTLWNQGAAPLAVQAVAIEDDPYGVLSVDDAPFVLAPDASRPLTLGAQWTPVATRFTATLVILSDDPIRPRLEVPVLVAPAEFPTCKVAFQPNTLSVPDPVDAPRDFTANVVNTGAGNCDLEQVVVIDCPADGGDCPDPFEAAASHVFTVRGAPDEVPIRVAPGMSATLKVRFLPPWSGEPETYRALLAVRLRGATGCNSTQAIDLPASMDTPNVLLTAAPCVPPEPIGCPATACGNAKPLADADAVVAYLSGLEWNLDRPWCLLGDDVTVAGPIEIDAASIPLPAFCDGADAPCSRGFRLWSAVPGVACLDEGEPLFCERIRIEDARFRVRAARMRLNGLAPSWLGVIDVLGPCDAACAEGELACPDHTCWPNALLHCQGCLGGSDAVCGCRDEAGPLPDDSRCFWVSGDVIGDGWCRCGTCSTTYQ